MTVTSTNKAVAAATCGTHRGTWRRSEVFGFGGGRSSSTIAALLAQRARDVIGAAACLRRFYAIRHLGWRTLQFGFPALLLLACQQSPVRAPEGGAEVRPPVRFLLTFDDGPSTWEPYNPTRAILEQLAGNPVEPSIKAVFFVQTRDPRAGGGPAGAKLLKREEREGHVLALHTATASGHRSHVLLNAAELDRSLADGIQDLHSIEGEVPRLVRPPFWSYNEAVLAAYRGHELNMLLTDVNARDGVIYGWIISLHRRSHIRTALAAAKAAIVQGCLPVVEGVVPVVITFHDTNTFTAHHMTEYLNILVEEAGSNGLPLANPPFYNDKQALLRAAMARAEAGAYAPGPGTPTRLALQPANHKRAQLSNTMPATASLRCGSAA